MRLRYTPEAISDIRSIKAYIRDQLHNPRAAARIGTMILDHCAALKTFPELGVSVDGKTGWHTDLRLLVCVSYAAIYRRDGDVISVVRVFHGRQDFLRILFSGP